MKFARTLPAKHVHLMSESTLKPNDPAATATNFLAHQSLFWLGFAGNLIAIAGYIAVTALFYSLFRPVNRTISFLAALFSLVGCVVLAVGCVFYAAPFIMLGGANYLSVFTPQQLQALALVFFKLYSQAFNTSLVFFGFYLLSIGYLIFRSTFMPRLLGLALMLGGLAAMIFMFPPAVRYLRYFLILDIGEGVLVFWLLIKGVDPDRWKEQARVANALL